MTSKTREIKIPIPTFQNKMLLRLALTHRSYINENPEEHENNERLEFLGDALLTFLSAEYLYGLYPDMGEDQMTRRRSALVDEKQLAKFAIELGLDLKMRLGKGAILDGGLNNPNLLSSAFEAFIGAYYLDNNSQIEPVRNFVKQLFYSIPENLVLSRSHVDSKNQLQEWAQNNISPQPPKYLTEKAGGADHLPIFVSQVLVGNKVYGEGTGSSKKDSEKRAAEDAIAKLKKLGLWETK